MDNFDVEQLLGKESDKSSHIPYFALAGEMWGAFCEYPRK